MLVALLKSVLYQAIMATRSSIASEAQPLA